MDSTGEILRRARNDRHLTLDELAIRTRINRKYLAAIESGDRDAIPGGFFYKSFVRQYATALTTDEANVLEQVEQSLAAEQPGPTPPPEEVLKALATRAEENASSSSTGSHSAASYAILLVLAIAGTSGLYMLWHKAQQAEAAGEVARPVPQAVKKEEASRAAAPLAAQPAPAPQAEATPSPVVAQPETVPTPSPEGSAPSPQAAAPPPQAVAQTPAPVPAPDSQTAANPPANPAANPGEDDKIALSISANDQSWVTVAADGKTIFNGLLAAGQSKAFAARENARMRVGNAGGLNVMFNGKPTGPLGADRQAVTLLFTPGSFEIVKPKPPDTPALPPPE